MKKVLIVFILLLLALVLYSIYSPKSATSDTQIDILSQTTQQESPVIDTSLPKTILAEPNTESDIAEIFPKNQSYSIFEELDIDDVRLDIEPIDGVEPIAALRMKKGTIKEIEMGDTILLPSIDGSTYELLVTHKEVSSRGNVSIDGSFSENGVNYTAILTEGNNAAFISMHTPEGSYEVELINGIGYIYATSDIEKAKIDYSKSDEVKKEEH